MPAVIVRTVSMARVKKARQPSVSFIPLSLSQAFRSSCSVPSSRGSTATCVFLSGSLAPLTLTQPSTGTGCYHRMRFFCFVLAVSLVFCCAPFLSLWLSHPLHTHTSFLSSLLRNHAAIAQYLLEFPLPKLECMVTLVLVILAGRLLLGMAPWLSCPDPISVFSARTQDRTY